MKLEFTKMQALGNDFILIDNLCPCLKNLKRVSKALCDRRFGVGADQMLLLESSKKANFKMRIFNADGSEVEMCGNGIRCLAKYIWDKKVKSQKSKVKSQIPPYPPLLKGGEGGLSIETLAGIIHLKKTGELIKVDMGEPILEAEKIPLKIDRGSGVRGQGSGLYSTFNSSLVTRHSSLVNNFPIKIDRNIFKITCVSMGNPHAVIVVNDVRSVPLEHYGPMIENNKIFPKRTNVEFIQILNRNNIKMRVWERGVGETMACGTGASAAGVASSLLMLTGRKVTVHLPGGKLFIEWSKKDNHVYMTGPAVKVFEGMIEI